MTDLLDEIHTKLQQGTPLVLAGPPGCGKTQLAELLAKKHGSFVSTDATALNSEEGVTQALQQQPTTWIVDGLPQSINAVARLKALISQESVQVRPRYRKHTVSIKTPHFIFCTQDIEPLRGLGFSRFFVLNMEGGAATGATTWMTAGETAPHNKPTHRNIKGWEEKLRWAAEDLADPTVPVSTNQAHLRRLVPYLKELVPLAWAELQRQKSESLSRKEAP